jgi:hypothetical protein
MEKALLVLSAALRTACSVNSRAVEGAAAAGLRISGRHDTFQFSPQYYSILEGSIFAEWGLNQANTRRGVFRVKNQ